MSERRPLTEGLKSQTPQVDPAVERQFVLNGKVKPSPDTSPDTSFPGMVSRSPINARIRTDLAHALKRASLERQLSGTVPYRVQDILESVLEPWLKTNGFIP